MAYGAAVLTPPRHTRAKPSPFAIKRFPGLYSTPSRHLPRRHHQHLATKVNAIDHQHHQKIFRKLEKNQSERCPEPGGGVEKNSDGASLWYRKRCCGGSTTTTNPIESCFSVDGAAGGAET